MNLGPLTRLSDDEKMFVKEVEKFAVTVVKPKVHEMDESEIMDKSVISGLFEMGLMGIEVPEEFGGAGGTFFMSILAIEALSKIDPSVAVLCDVQNTLVNNIFMRWGSPEQKRNISPGSPQRKLDLIA